MNNAPREPGRTPPIPAKTALSDEERRVGATSRKVAFGVLAVIAVAALLIAPYSWYVWTVTAGECVNTYMAGGTPRLLERSANSAENQVGAGTGTVTETWQEQFIALDISSFSALIIALLFTRLAYVGTRSIFQWAWQEREAYFHHAHHAVLFSEAFDTLAIRLGLLGTLLSFLLAALTLRHDGNSPPVAAVRAASPEAAAPADVEELSGEETPTSELSGRMFLLLCASLVSTFVGTGVAYVVTPSLNWLHDRAAGRHQIGDAEADLVAEEFFRQIARTSERLVQFESTTARLSEVVEHIARFESNVGRSSEQLASLLGCLQGAIETFEISNHTGQELARRMAGMEAQNDRLRIALERLPEALVGPLESIGRTSQRFKDAAQSGEAAFRELKVAAGTAHESLHDTTQRAKVTWKALQDIRDSLAKLAHRDQLQTDEVRQLVGEMKAVSHSLSVLSQHLAESLVGQGGGSDPHPAAQRTPIDHVPRKLRGGASPIDSSSVLPWWRRWLG